MALDFGVTVLPDPPYQRLVDLIVKAESLGFDSGWTYDSPILWQEPYPLITLLADRTSDDADRHVRDQPGHARTGRHGIRARDAAGHQRRAHGARGRPR